MFVKNKRKRLNLILLLITLLFLFLTVVVILFPPTAVDVGFSRRVQQYQQPELDNFMQAISYFGQVPVSLIMVLITALCFYLFKFKRTALFVLFTLLSGVVSTAFKMAINRPRPTDDLVRIVEKARQQSFPSGHVLFYTIFFGFLIVLMVTCEHIPSLLLKLVSILSGSMILLVPLSRIYLGAHWFTDVLAAGLLGLICLYVLSFYYLQNVSEKR